MVKETAMDLDKDTEIKMKFDTNTYFALNGVLVRFFKEQGVKDKEEMIVYLERILKWYKKMGYATLDKH